VYLPITIQLLQYSIYMDYSIFYIALKDLLAYYKHLSIMEIIGVSFWHIFISWNGLQFIMNPQHIYLIIYSGSIEENVNTVLEYQSSFLPSFFYICITLIIVYLFLKVFFEVTFESECHQQDISLKQRVNVSINFCIPAFFHTLGVLFILASAYLIVVIIYLILIITNIQIVPDVYDVIRYSLWYFGIGVVLFNAVLLDFVLPLMRQGNTFSVVLKKCYYYFTENKMNLCFFYSLKLCMIGISMMLYLFFLAYVVREPFLTLTTTSGLQNNLYNTSIILLAFTVSVVVFAFFMQFFSMYCYQIKNIIFCDLNCNEIEVT